jgi:hypothetical protein
MQRLKQYCEQSIFITPFHQNETVNIKSGIGDYILYHGSLDVVENHQAATWLIMQVFSKIDKKVIIKEIIKQVYNLAEAELGLVDDQIEYNLDNKIVKKKTLLKKGYKFIKKLVLGSVKI